MSAHPMSFRYSQFPEEETGHSHGVSGARAIAPRSSAYQADALLLSYRRMKLALPHGSAP